MVKHPVLWCLATAYTVVFMTGAGASDVAFSRYDDMVKRLCPAKHLDWLDEGSKNDIYEFDFRERLNPQERQRLDKETGRDDEGRLKPCADRDGLSCVNALYVKAADHLHLLEKLAQTACHQPVECSAPYVCRVRSQ
jgi:hypothetical protein